MKKVVFVQEKPFVPRFLGWFFVVLVLYYLVNENAPFMQLLLMSFIAFILLAYEIAYVVSPFKSTRQFKLFSNVVFESPLLILNADYVSVFPVRSILQSDWGGPIAAIGKKTSADRFVVRIFEENRHLTLLRTSKLEEAVRLGKELSVMLKVDFHDRTV